jgi:DNA-binding response OmpR family regulator
MRILFIEDDLEFRAELVDYLASHGFEIETFDDFSRVGEALRAPGERLVLLDLKVGSQDGIDFLRDQVRALRCPCVVLSGNADETDRIVSLELGADDFILKSTRPREILARLRAVMRRSRAPAAQQAAAVAASGGWQFLPERRDLLRPDGSPVPLTTAEFNLLHVLVQNQGKPVSREVLFDTVFGRPFNPMDRAVDNLVAKLRSKLGDSVKDPSMIRTIRPIGYVFTGFAEELPRAAPSN